MIKNMINLLTKFIRFVALTSSNSLSLMGMYEPICPKTLKK